MSGGAGQTFARQANDARAAAGGLRPALPSWTPERQGGTRQRARSSQSKKAGCQKRGPGRASKECNKCADQAVAAIDAMAGIPPALLGASMDDIRRVRFLGGVNLNGVGGGPFGAFGRPGSSLRVGLETDGSPGYGVSTDCQDCPEVDPVALCGNSATAPTNSYWPRDWPETSHVGAWTAVLGGGCTLAVECVNYSTQCGIGTDGLPYDARATGNPCEDAGMDGCIAEFVSWVYVPTDSGGECRAIWDCDEYAGGLGVKTKHCGTTPAMATDSSPTGDWIVASTVVKAKCDGVQTSNRAEPVPPDLPPDLHGVSTGDCAGPGMKLTSWGCTFLQHYEGGHGDVWTCPAGTFLKVPSVGGRGCSWRNDVRVAGDCTAWLFECCPPPAIHREGAWEPSVVGEGVEMNVTAERSDVPICTEYSIAASG